MSAATHYIVYIADKRNPRKGWRTLCGNCTCIELLYFGLVGSYDYGREADELIREANKLEGFNADSTCREDVSPDAHCLDCSE